MYIILSRRTLESTNPNFNCRRIAAPHTSPQPSQAIPDPNLCLKRFRSTPSPEGLLSYAPNFCWAACPDGEGRNVGDGGAVGVPRGRGQGEGRQGAAEKGRMHVASWAEHRFGVKDNAQASVNDLAPQSYCSLHS